MSKGILGPLVAREPLRSGKTLDFRDASKVEGVTCEIHHVSPDELPEIFHGLLARPGGVDACTPCLERCQDILGARLGRR